MRARFAFVGIVGTILACLPAASAIAAAPAVSLSPTVGPPTTSVAVKGTGFGPSEVVALAFDAQQVGTASTNSLGAFSTKIKIPKAAPPGLHAIHATGQTSTTAPIFRIRLIA